MYEGYKGQRQACPDAVKEAIPRLQHLLKAMGVPIISVSECKSNWRQMILLGLHTEKVPRNNDSATAH